MLKTYENDKSLLDKNEKDLNELIKIITQLNKKLLEYEPVESEVMLINACKGQIKSTFENIEFLLNNIETKKIK
jgi:uncharacterized protein with von Willebrand factor type A (vWA) domain